MEVKVVVNIILGVPVSADEVPKLEVSRVGGRVHCEIKCTVMVDIPDVSIKGKMPTRVTMFSTHAKIPGSGTELGNETWVNGELMNLAHHAPRSLDVTDPISPYQTIHLLTMLGQQIANGATVVSSRDPNTRAELAHALVVHMDVSFVAVFNLNTVDDAWGIEVLKDPVKTAAVEAALSKGYKGALPPEEWDFMKEELNSLVYDGERVWGLNSKYAAAYLGVRGQLERYSGLWNRPESGEE